MSIICFRQVEQTFEALSGQFRDKVSDCVQGIVKDVCTYAEEMMNCFTSIKSDIGKRIILILANFNLLYLLFFFLNQVHKVLINVKVWMQQYIKLRRV